MYPFEPYEREELPADELESKCAPYPTGDFIQPWLAADWSVSRWETHLEALKAAGIEFVIPVSYTHLTLPTKRIV